MTVDALRAHILTQIADLEARYARITQAPRAPWLRGTTPMEASGHSDILGQLKAYRDVLGRLPGAGKVG